MAGYIGNAPVPQATQTRDNFTATAGQTSFATSGYTPGYLDVYLNGVRLDESDYTATNGSDVVLDTGAAVDDVVSVVAFQTFEVNAGVSLDDNVKAKFGAGNDLQIYHNGSNSYIADEGTGDLIISGSTNVKIRSNGGEDMGVFTKNGAATLYYDNASKLATTSTGVDVTGTITADGLTVDTDTLHVNSGQVSIGNTSPTSYNTLEIYDANSAITTNEVASGGSGVASWRLKHGTNHYGMYVSSANALVTYDYGSSAERMRIDSSGNLLVGTTSASIYNDTSGNGIQLNGASGQAVIAKQSTSSADPALWLNNTGTDGEIATFAKDGTKVGSIGVEGGDSLFIQGGTSSGAGLLCHGGAGKVLPVRNGTSIDNTIDLGQDSRRFKDIYAAGELNFSNAVASNGYDINKIRLYDGGSSEYGFGVSGSQLNYCTNGNHVFYQDTIETMRINNNGIVTKPYQPAFYAYGGSPSYYQTSSQSNYSLRSATLQ